MNIKKTIWEIVNIEHHETKASLYFDVFIFVLIVLNVIAVILESVNSIYSRYENLFYYFEIFSIFMFTIEYLLNIIFCTQEKKYSKPFSGRLKFILTPGALIDLIAILPFYVPFINLDLRFVRIFRILRIIKILRIERYLVALKTIKQAVKEKKEDLLTVAGVFVLLLTFSSIIMFYLENQAQPNVFSSIPAAMWWSIVTLTTIGYGDIYPITPLGKFVASFIIIFGIGFIALPAGILSSSFMELSKREKTEKNRCPKCDGLLK